MNMEKVENVTAEEQQSIITKLVNNGLVQRQMKNTKNAAIIVAQYKAGELVIKNMADLSFSVMPGFISSKIKATNFGCAFYEFTLAQALALTGGVFLGRMDPKSREAKLLQAAIDSATLAAVSSLAGASGIEEFINNVVLSKEVKQKLMPVINAATNSEDDNEEM